MITRVSCRACDRLLSWLVRYAGSARDTTLLNLLQDTVHTLVYAGLLEELVEILEMSEKDLVEIKAAALRTLTSITHLERTPNLPK